MWKTYLSEFDKYHDTYSSDVIVLTLEHIGMSKVSKE